MKKIDQVYLQVNLKDIEDKYYKTKFFQEDHYCDEYKTNKHVSLDSSFFKPGVINGSNILDLRSNHKIAVITVNFNFFHFIIEQVGQILSLLTLDPDIEEIIFDIPFMPNGMFKFIDYFKQAIDEIDLGKGNIKHQAINLSKYDGVVLNNFYVADATIEMHHPPVVHNFFKNYVKDENIKPFRKVYLSRKRMQKREYLENSVSFENISVSHDNRIDDHDKIENLFFELGYEIVCSEDFKTFEDQINYFYEVETLIGLTGAGLSNMVFMQSGGTVIELFTPLLIVNGEQELCEEFHFFYHIIATAKNHRYISINNSERQTELIKDRIHTDTKFLEFIKQGNNNKRLIIFDLDGVLIDSKTMHFDALNKALLEVDNNFVISIKEQEEVFEGLTTKDKLKKLTDLKNLDPKLYSSIWTKKQEYFFEMLSSLERDNDLVNMLSYIKQNNIKIAVATNSIRSTLNYCLDSLGIKDLVDYSLSNEDVSMPKPNAEIYLKCIEHFDVRPSNTMIYEDSDVGKTAARSSGALLVEVNNRYDLTMKKIMKSVSLLKNND
jgi:beta-phosphoglucomutase-like phosphatase (HAD superfamily)